MKIVISANAAATELNSEQTVTDPGRLQTLDGLDYDTDRCAKYLDHSLQDIGITGGVIRLIFDAAAKQLRVVTEYQTARRLTDAELEKLVQETTGQWSDGIGEGDFRHRRKVKMDVDLDPPSRGPVHAEQIDDGKKARAPKVTPLAKAIRAFNLVEIERLLTEAPDVNAKDKDGVSPFLLACHYQFFKLALEMLANGADPRATDKQGQTPLTMVARAQCRFGEDKEDAQARLDLAAPLARALIQKGAYLNVVDNHGFTPLKWATNSRNLPVKQVLIEAGAKK
jgi:uncharacterized protein